MASIKLRRGLKTNLSAITLNEGEPAFTTDENFLYIGTASGKAVFVCLTTDGKLPASVMPHQAITDVFVIASEAAMLALPNAAVGDVCIRTDVNQNYILQAVPASTLSNWVLMSVSNAGVDSIAGKTGNLTLADLGLDDTSLFSKIRSTVLTGLSTATNAAIAATDTVLAALGKLQAQITLRATIASPTLTGTPKAPTAATGTNTTQIATTAFVTTAVTNGTNTVDGGTF